MRLLGHAVEEAIMFIQLWMRLLGHAVEEAIMFIQLWMRLLGHAVEEAIMFIQLWMRLLGHAVEEAIMFIQLWMRLLWSCCGRGYHVYTAMDEITRPCCEEAIMFIQLWMRLLGHAVLFKELALWKPAVGELLDWESEPLREHYAVGDKIDGII